MKDSDLRFFFSGEQLYGDDLSPSQIEAWYEDEKEGYANLGSKHTEEYTYVYHALNQLHGFRYLPAHPFDHALGFGSAYGDEFKPLAHRIRQITIVDPSDAFTRDEVYGMPATYIKPAIDGTLPFEDNTFDLLTCLGVLHHIPNVSYVIGELYRCMEPGGYALIREPIISMGDWRKPRPGLTKRERGIPLALFRQMIKQTGFQVDQEQFCTFPLLPKIWKTPYNKPLVTRLDALVSQMFAWNIRYHATSPLQKFRPRSVYYVLSKVS